jgi:hypothetical protein
MISYMCNAVSWHCDSDSQFHVGTMAIYVRANSASKVISHPLSVLAFLAIANFTERDILN